MSDLDTTSSIAKLVAKSNRSLRLMEKQDLANDIICVIQDARAKVDYAGSADNDLANFNQALRNIERMCRSHGGIGHPEEGDDEMCPGCNGTGLSGAGEILDHAVFMLLNAFGCSENGEYRQLTTVLAGRAPNGLMGHGKRDTKNAMRKIIELAGLPEDFAVCKKCGGKYV